MLLVSTTRIIPGRAVPSFLSGRYPAVKVRKKLYVTFTINGNYEDKTEYKQNITDTNFELVMTNSPVRKVINFSL